MVGIVVSNGVLLVHYANLRRERGEELHVAAVDAAVPARPTLPLSLTRL